MRYGTYDATGLLGAENVIGLSLGNGWYRGRLGWEGKDALYGNELGAFSELTVVFDDGHRQFIATDESWRAGASATTATSTGSIGPSLSRSSGMSRSSRRRFGPLLVERR